MPAAEDQHGQDPGALGVDDQAGVGGQQVDGGLGGEEGADDRQHGHQQQGDAAVGEQQDDDDHGERGVQQGAVDAGEGVGGVGGESAGTGDVDFQAVGVPADDAPDVLDRVRDAVPAALVDADRDDELGGARTDRTVVGGAQGAGAEDAVLRHGLDAGGVRLDLRTVRLREPVRPRVDHDGGGGVGQELLLQIQDLRGFRAARQPRGRVVLLGVRELLGQRRDRHQQDDPQHENDPLAALSADEQGQLA